MAVRKIKLSPLSQETGNLTDNELSNRRKNRNLIRDNKGNSTLIEQTAESITLLASSVGEIEGRVTQNEASIVIQASQIESKVSQTDLDAQLTNYSTIVQTSNSITSTVSETIKNRIGKWERVYNVRSDNPLLLVEDDGSALSDLYTYTVTAKTTGTSTNTTAIAIFKANPSGGWTLIKVKELGTVSNHPEFYLSASGLPAIRLYNHTTYYNVIVSHEKSIGVDNFSTFAQESYSTITQTATDITLAVSTASNGTDSIVPYDTIRWEQGGLSTTTGANVASTIRLRTAGYHPVVGGKDYIFEASSGLAPTGTVLIFYNGTTFISAVNFSPSGKRVVAPANATQCRVYTQKTDATTFPISQMPDHFVRVVSVSQYLNGAKYTFDGTNATFTGGGLIIKNNDNQDVFTADTSGNLVLTANITAVSGSIAGFSLIPNYVTVLAGTSGSALTAGSGATRVGVSPGVLATNGYRYVFWAGSNSPNLAPFRVVDDGSVRCDNLVSGGWTMEGSSISRGTTILSASGTNGTISLGGAVISSNASTRIQISASLEITGDRSANAGGINSGTSIINLSTETTRMNYNGQWTATGVRWGVNGGSALSDEILKTNIKDFDDDFILKLRPVSFRYISDETQLQYGLIAQEVESLLEDDVALVKKPNKDNYFYGLDYTQLIAPMISTIQRLEKRITQLELQNTT